MADYIPVISGSQSFSTASAAVTGGQLCVVSGSGTVAPSSGASAAWVGIAGFDAANGDRLTLEKGGVQRPTAAGAITAGDAVIPAANGRVASLGAGTNYAQVVGVALTTAADGATVEVDWH